MPACTNYLTAHDSLAIGRRASGVPEITVTTPHRSSILALGSLSLARTPAHRRRTWTARTLTLMFCWCEYEYVEAARNHKFSIVRVYIIPSLNVTSVVVLTSKSMINRDQYLLWPKFSLQRMSREPSRHVRYPPPLLPDEGAIAALWLAEA